MDSVGPVGPLKGTSPTQPTQPTQTGQVEGERSFKDILKESIDQVNGLQQEADLMVEKFFKGEATEEMMTVAAKKAQLAFEALMQIRNKLVDAFEEIQRMRI